MTSRLGMVGIIGSTTKATLWLAFGALALGGAAATRHVFAQEPAATDAAKPLTADELEKLVGPIALYPDDLVAIVLPASTYPLQVVQAARLLEERKKDPSVKPNDEWDDSVVALLNYPEVVKLMNDDLDWTWRLGDAVINQRPRVLDAIQGFRDRAYAAGNLRTDDRQVVENDGGAIAIKPADPQVIYVPYYEPERVVVYQTAPVYNYYPWGYPLYYYPYPYGYSFATGFFWGVTSAFVIGWNSHYVNVYPCGYYGHPYYGHTYYNPYYARYNANVSVSHGGYVWEPHYRPGGQPFTRSDGRQLTRTRDGDANARVGAPSTRSGGSYRGSGDAVSRSAGRQPGTTDPVVADSRSRAIGGTATRGERSEPGAASGMPRSSEIREELRARRAASPDGSQRAPGQYRAGDGQAGGQRSALTEPRDGGQRSALTQQPSNAPRRYVIPQPQDRSTMQSYRSTPPANPGVAAPRAPSGNGGGSYRGQRMAAPQRGADDYSADSGGSSPSGSGQAERGGSSSQGDGGGARSAPPSRGGGSSYSGSSGGARSTGQGSRGGSRSVLR